MMCKYMRYCYTKVTFVFCRKFACESLSRSEYVSVIKGENTDHDCKVQVCMICNKTFAYASLLYNHMSTHSKDIPNRCDERFDTTGHLSRHRRANLAEKWKQRMCKVCHKTFAFPCLLSQHMATHSGARPYQCDVCGKHFKIRSDVSTHKKVVHSEVRPYQCSLCERSFKSKCVLVRHQKVLHSHEKPYECSVCGARFALPGKLTKHKIVHSDERRYECTLCGKRFKYHSGIFMHRQQCGVKRERQFACEVCARCFYTCLLYTSPSPRDS